MAGTPRVFVVSGPSGTGKGTLVSRIRDKRPDLGLAVSATTRKPRPGERDGISYYFMTEEKFTQLANENAFVEWDGHFEKRYGTLWSEITPHLQAGNSVIVEIDVNGAFNVKRAIPDAVLIFIAPPSFEELAQRLRLRGSETEEEIAGRLARVDMEMECAPRYDEVVVNDDLDKATAELEALLEKYEADERK